MLNNAALCRMPLLPNNIPISDSGFENVNAFNTVTPHSHQKPQEILGLERLARACRNTHTHTAETNMDRGGTLSGPRRLCTQTQTCKDTQRNTETDTYMLTPEPHTHTRTHAAGWLRGCGLLIVSGSVSFCLIK